MGIICKTSVPLSTTNMKIFRLLGQKSSKQAEMLEISQDTAGQHPVGREPNSLADAADRYLDWLRRA
jgi:hypothetical protein